MSLDALKARSRGKLHAALSYRAFYFAGPARVASEVKVRTHIKNPTLQGDMKGTNLSYAETVESVTKLIVLEADVPNPRRGDLVTVGPNEGYRVDHVDPPYRGTITLAVGPLTSTEIAGLGYPESQ